MDCTLGWFYSLRHLMCHCVDNIFLFYVHSQGWKLTLARGELNSVRASGSSNLTSPVGEWEFYGDVSIIS